jgi:hypothetical protein
MTTPSGESADDGPAPRPDQARTDLPAPQDVDDATLSDVESPVDTVVGSLVDEMREELGGNA